MGVCAINRAGPLLKPIVAFMLVWTCSFAPAFSADRLNLTLETIELVTWEERDIFLAIEDRLKQEKYHPMIKVRFSSPVNIMQLSQHGMNVWAESFTSNGEDRVDIKATQIYFEGFQISDSRRLPFKENYAPNFYAISEAKSVRGYVYSLLLFTEWPSPYDTQEVHTHLLNDRNTYSFRDLKSNITITVSGVKPFAREKLEAESFVIDRSKILNLVNREHFGSKAAP